MKCLSENVISAFYNLHLEHNASWRQQFQESWDSHQTLETFFNFILSAFLMISNSMMLYGIYKTNLKFSIHKKMFLVTCICGLACGLVYVFENVGKLLAYPDECLQESIVDTALNFIIFFDFGNLLCICIVRFLAIKYPFDTNTRKDNLHDLAHSSFHRSINDEIMLLG